MTCAVCGASSPRTKHRLPDTLILQCPRCDLAWWPPPQGFRPERVYDAGYFSGAGASHGYDDYAALAASFRRTFDRRLARLQPPRPGARLLDVGAAYGYGVDAARRAGWNAFGLEISTDAARNAQAEVPGRIAVGSGLHTPIADAALDALTLWDVLEHLPDPHAAIAEVARVLRPEGRLVLTTGDVGSLVARLSGPRWHLFTLPEHLFFYSRESLRRLLGAHGLRVERMTTDASWYTLGYLVERLRKTLLRRPGRGSARWPGAGVCVPLDLFDVVTVTAVRERPDAD